MSNLINLVFMFLVSVYFVLKLVKIVDGYFKENEDSNDMYYYDNEENLI